jgi:hypothetical protein
VKLIDITQLCTMHSYTKFGSSTINRPEEVGIESCQNVSVLLVDKRCKEISTRIVSYGFHIYSVNESERSTTDYCYAAFPLHLFRNFIVYSHSNCSTEHSLVSKKFRFVQFDFKYLLFEKKR